MPDIVTADGTFGTQIHDALAKGDATGLEANQLSIYDSCVEITDRVIKEAFGSDAAKATIVRERRFWCSVLAVPGDKSKEPKRYHHSAKLDFLARVGKRGLIIEYKTLPGDVDESPTNDQLRDQAVLAARNAMLDEIVTIIVQPLVTQSPTPTMYNKLALDQSEQEMFDRIRLSNHPKSKRIPNAISCKYCKARFECIEHERWAASLLPDTTSVIGTPIAQWSPEQRAAFLSIRGPAKRWLDDCYEHIKTGIKNDPSFVPGYTLKPGAVQRPVNDAQELFNRFNSLATTAGISTDEVLPMYMQSVRIHKETLEGILRKVSGLKGKALAAKMDDLLAGITDEKPNDSSLVKV